MDNTIITLAANIQNFRRKTGLTQEELAEKLGVTFQAVSKWETAKSAPDILLLPLLADLFGCSIDELFSREIKQQDMFPGREWILEHLQALRIGKVTVGDREFDACYLGVHDMSTWSDYATKREYWRLENIRDFFKNWYMTHDVLPYSNYPAVDIKRGQVFAIEYHTRTGTVDRRYYIADGTVWQDMLCTRQIVAPNT